MKEVIRKRIVFCGDVQGVGFRYRARCAAEGVGATGWVKNEYDGSVMMEIQGTEAQIEQVIRTVGRGMFIRIENMSSELIPIKTDETGFHTLF